MNDTGQLFPSLDSDGCKLKVTRAAKAGADDVMEMVFQAQAQTPPVCGRGPWIGSRYICGGHGVAEGTCVEDQGMAVGGCMSGGPVGGLEEHVRKPTGRLEVHVRGIT